MGRLSLRSIIGKQQSLGSVIRELSDEIGMRYWIEDAHGKLLLGDKFDDPKTTLSVGVDAETLGWVKGDEKVEIIGRILSSVLEKESEKKRLGGEVLSLYQQINIIFNFTETLTQSIEPDVIARLTLEQAIHSVASDSGVIVLWDDHQKELQIPAVAGEQLFDIERVRANAAQLLKIGLGGQSEIITDVEPLIEMGIVGKETKSVIYAAMKVKHRIMGAVILAGRSADQFSAAHLKLLVTLALQSSAAIESALLYERNIQEAREREEAMRRIHEVTIKFVPNEFIRSLGKERLTDVRLGDQVEKVVTVLFTDIRDFTTLSESMTPEENFEFVSTFNSHLGPIIRSHGGFINQYLGDSIMAIFPNSPGDAIRAGVAMQKAVQQMNRSRLELDLPPIRAGIGMHAGPLIMGITGDEHRLDAATISDTVNTAARIESLTKYYRSPLLLSQETIDGIDGSHEFTTRFLGCVRLKGKRNLLNIMECLDGHEGTAFDKKVVTLPLFKTAMDLYHDRHFDEAVTKFKAILETDPDDLTVIHLCEKAMKYQREDVPEDWTGVEEMIGK